MTALSAEQLRNMAERERELLAQVGRAVTELADIARLRMEGGQDEAALPITDHADEGVRHITHSLPGDLDITLTVDGGDIKVDVAGIDVDSTPGDTFPARVWGFLPPAQAREFAHSVFKMAARAEGASQ